MSFSIIEVRNETHVSFSGHSEYQQRVYLQPGSVEYVCDIAGMFAQCVLKQTYKIPQSVEETEYKFPLDGNSALSSLVVVTPREKILGVVKEKVEALKMYSTGIKEGRQVVLAAEHATERDITVLRMGNMLKGDEITIIYEYQTQVTFSETNGVFYIPTWISPRYGLNDYIPHANSQLTAVVNLHGKVNQFVPNTPGLDMTLGKDFISFRYNAEGFLLKDVEIKYNLDPTPFAYKFQSHGHHVAIVSFVPEIASTRVHRDICFVVDRSGSMQDGERLVNAKKALTSVLNFLRKDDVSFNIISFGSTYELMYNTLVTASEANIDDAIRRVSYFAANLGGTEAYNALYTAHSNSCKNVIFLTDGDTGDNYRLRELVKMFNSVFVLGLGDGINRSNLLDIAQNGHGTALFTPDFTDPTENMKILFSKITQPLFSSFQTNLESSFLNDLTSLSNRQSNLDTKPLIPSQFYNICNLVTKYPLISGQFHTIFAILDDIHNQTSFIISERTNTHNLEIPFTDLPKSFNADGSGCLAVRRVIQHNTELINHDRLVKLACEFNVMTQHTSLIAVSEGVVVVVPDRSKRSVNTNMYDDIEEVDPVNYYDNSDLYSAAQTKLVHSHGFEKLPNENHDPNINTLQTNKREENLHDNSFVSNYNIFVFRFVLSALILWPLILLQSNSKMRFLLLLLLLVVSVFFGSN